MAVAMATVAHAKIRISSDLALPDDAVTRTFVVYGGKGKGKTNFGAVLSEELAKRHLRFCVTDPLDVWWGLQHGKTRADGGGIDVVILGGTHGDIPITPDAGEIVADFVADEPVNTVIVMRHPDGRMWTNGERIRFMSKFARRLFARQGEKRIPLMLIIDEAGRFVPQTAGKGDFEIAECISAISEIVEWGRNVGLGVCLITQRAARMAKAVSELAECMVAFNTVGPLSIGAIVDWFGEHIPRERQHELVEILRKLPVGRALIVSPEWLGFEGEAQIRLRETFDSSATPKAGGALRPPSRARKPDLEKYRARMAATIEKAEQSDPTKLQKRVRDLEARLEKATRPVVANTKTVEKVKIVEIPVVKDSQIARLEKIYGQMSSLSGTFNRLGHEVATIGVSITSALSAARTSEKAARAAVAAGAHGRALTEPVHPAESRPRSPQQPLRSGPTEVGQADGDRSPGARGPRDSDGKLPPGELAVLASIAHFSDPVTRENLTVLTGYKKSSRDTYIYKLSAKGLIEQRGSGLIATAAGIDALGHAYEPPATGSALRERWLTRLRGGEQMILELLIREYPQAVSREWISERTNYQKSSRDTYIYKLKARKLVEDAGPGMVRASAALFD